MEAVSDALGIIFTESYISLAALLGLFLMCFGFASAGGVGASAAPAGSTVAKFAKDEDSVRSRLALRYMPVHLCIMLRSHKGCSSFGTDRQKCLHQSLKILRSSNQHILQFCGSVCTEHVLFLSKPYLYLEYTRVIT